MFSRKTAVPTVFFYGGSTVLDHIAQHIFSRSGKRRRRQECLLKLCIFHFPDMTEFYNVRGNIRTLYPHAFFNQPLQPPIGTVWILVKIGVHHEKI